MLTRQQSDGVDEILEELSVLLRELADLQREAAAPVLRLIARSEHLPAR